MPSSAASAPTDPRLQRKPSALPSSPLSRQPSGGRELRTSLLFAHVVIGVLFIGIAGPADAQVRQASPCKREEAELFLPLAGQWSVEWTDRLAPGKYARAKARARIEADLLGCAVVEHFAGTRQGEPFMAISVVSFGNSETLQRSLIDSSHGQFLLFEGSREGKVVRFEWVRASPGRTMKLRHEYRAIQKNSFETATQLSTDDGRTWDVVQRAKYERD